MCDFCTQHGEGKTWYLNAKNYSTELLHETKRKNFIEHFYDHVIYKGNRQISMMERLFGGRLAVPKMIRNKISRDQKSSHFGQVVPVEEIKKIFSMSNSITRLACGCKWAKERKESRVCFGISFGPPDWYDRIDIEYFGAPDKAGIEVLSQDEALKSISETDKEGMVHSIWTFETPFIGAVCNCDKQYCLAMRMTVGLKTPVMFRAEFIAEIDDEKCSGCRACMDRCQFSAIRYGDKADKCLIDKTKCYGCGTCRSECPSDAISLTERKSDPVAASIW